MRVAGVAVKPSEIIQALVEHPAVGYGPVRSLEDARFFAICAWLDMHAARCAEVGVMPSGARVHISHRDSLERFGTGHPSEESCVVCGRPTFDILDRYQTADRKPVCGKACFDRVLAAPVGVYAGDGHPALRALADQTGSYENTEDPE